MVIHARPHVLGRRVDHDLPFDYHSPTQFVGAAIRGATLTLGVPGRLVGNG
jgi:hypothetical protein